MRPTLRPWLAGGLLCVGAAAAVVWIDRPLALASQQLGSEARGLARLGSALGNSAWVLVPSAAVLLLRRAGALSALQQDWVKRCRQLFWTVAASGLLADVLKGVVARPRPKLWLRDGVVEPRWFHWFDAAWASMLPLQVAAASGSGTLLPGIRAAAATWLRVQAALRNDFNVSSVAFAPDGTPLPIRGDARSYPLPVVSAGVAWLLYASRAALGEGDAGAPALLRGATDALDYLFALPYDSYWEVLMPFGALASARVNAEQGARYDTAQLLNNILQPGLPAHFPFRWGWGTLAGAWGEPPVDVAGLTGASSDRGGYGFAFDTFATLSALVPVARYEAQFARALGRYASNAANAARLFFPFANAADAQSDAGWVASAGAGAQALAYEGVRRWGFNATDANITGPYATGDGKSQDNMPTNLAVYGGAYVGLMAALVLPTADEGVAAFDARATDWWARDGYPTTLLYNGRGAPVETLLALPARSAALFDVYDAVSQAVVARNVTPPSVSVTLGPDEAAVLVAYPAGLPLVRDDAHNWLLAGGIVVDWQLVPRGGTAGREQ